MLVEIGTNMSREEVFVLEDTKFQLQQSEAFSPHQRFSTMVTLPKPQLHSRVPQNLDEEPKNAEILQR